MNNNLQFAVRYVVAVVATLILFAGINLLLIGDLALRCADAGGQPVPHVRNFLCADSQGRIIPID